MKPLMLISALLVGLLGNALPRETGVLAGKVVDKKNGAPLPGVNVTLVGTVMGTATDAAGRFELKRIPVGTYDVQFTMIGYKRHRQTNVSIQAGQTTTLHIEMTETVLETPELVVTAGKRRQNISDSPNSVGVLTQKELLSRSDIYLDKVLQYASGVNFIGSQINIRGSSGFNYGAGSRVLLVVDGVPVMPGDSGDIKWDNIPTTQIERVEVVKGAGSALYGSSALGGVVNVVTKRPGGKPTTTLRLASGVYDRPAYPEWRWTDKLLYFTDVDADHARQIGRSELLVAAGRHQSTGYAQNTSYLRHNGSIKWAYRFSGNHYLTAMTSYEGGERQSSLMWRSQRRALEVNPEALGDYVVSHKYLLNLQHQWVVSKKLRLQSRLSYYTNYWKNYFHDNLNASTAQKPGYEIQADWQISERNSLIIGSEGSWDHVKSGLVGNHDQHTLAGYIQNERRVLRNVNLTLGARYDHQWVDIGLRDSEWSPKAGVVWHLRPELALRASSGRGFRAASMSERFPNGIYSGLVIVPNLNLKSESSWSHEAGINWSPRPQFYVDVAGFINDYWDMIEPRPDENQVIRFINVTRARISGVEMTATLQPIKPLFLNLGFTFMNPQDLKQNTVLSYRPKSLATLSAAYTFGSFEAGADFRYVSRIERVEVYPNDERVPQKVLDLRAAWKRGSLRLALNVNNVFNYNYTQMERTLMPIRHYVLSAIVQQ
ncbi:MAG: TonB-dependent receptor [candidate division KSB1 bacterium]|nr:TonB-dependent receptor [candidate division KSB1 bacterium]